MLQNPTYIKQRGLTLLETLVFLFAIGVVLLIIIPQILYRSEETRIEEAKNHIYILQFALDAYQKDNGFYPSTVQGFSALMLPPSDPPIPQNWNPNKYLERIPSDPWGAPYHYLNPGLVNPNGVDIFTYGPTEKPGGTGENATIGNWK